MGDLIGFILWAGILNQMFASGRFQRVTMLKARSQSLKF